MNYLMFTNCCKLLTPLEQATRTIFRFFRCHRVLLSTTRNNNARKYNNFFLCPAITHADTQSPVIRRPCANHSTRALTFVTALAMRVSLELRLYLLSVVRASSRRELKIQQSSALSVEHNRALRPHSCSSEERGACLLWQAVAAMLWHEIVRCSCSAPASICSVLYVRKILKSK